MLNLLLWLLGSLGSLSEADGQSPPSNECEDRGTIIIWG
jgi:hypothetical protein